ncbi:small subunit ribosomal protein S18 [Emericellopsis cladophorae]|uniref:Small ribosomal subunit protein bS18m n=1 Tax=Emericellopsis cladophorae TaxID=2686198 RepID=A0A9P9Y695_9HYPO|nr:small subunit ribosomal protein S18 [Emericellopsis cladophorae]KAI6784201.1 small subunit ribosomal protein S18 [Emericellopsis cladophorae]
MVPRFPAPRGLASSFRQFSTSASSLAPREGPAPPRRSTTATLLNLNNSQKPDTRRGDAAQRIVQNTRARQDASSANIYALTEANKQRRTAEEYMKDMPRHWLPGDVYSPHDLSGAEMEKTRKRNRRRGDAIDALGIRPQDHYKNFSMINEFVNSTNQILPGRINGLRAVNQRRVAKMVRRAIGMGLYPSTHQHPEMFNRKWFPDQRQAPGRWGN